MTEMTDVKRRRIDGMSMEQIGLFIFSSGKSGFWLNEICHYPRSQKGGHNGIGCAFLMKRDVLRVFRYINEKSSCGQNTYTK
jgi:hypothetical protein